MGPTSGGATAGTSQDGRGLSEPALGVFERDRGVGRLREGMNRVDGGVGVVGPTEWMYSLGIKLKPDQDVDDWRVQRATFIDPPLFGRLNCQGRISDLGSRLLRRLKGSAKRLTPTVGPQNLTPEAEGRQVEHLCKEVKVVSRILYRLV